MEKLRVLCIGFNKDTILEVPKTNIEFDINALDNEYLIFLLSMTTLYDYHVILLDLPSLNAEKMSALNAKKAEFEVFFKTGGILCVVLSPAYINNKLCAISCYEWCPLDSKLISLVVGKGGNTKNTTSGHWLANILSKYTIYWYAHLNGVIGTTIATNLANFPIASEVQMSTGRMILLPSLSTNDTKIKSNFWADILLQISKYGIKKTIEGNPIPLWAHKYKLPNEEQMLEEYNKIKQKLEKFNSIRRLIYEGDYALVDAVSNIFKEWGFEVQIKEYSGNHDLEIRKGSFFGLMEIKGLSGYANNEDLRQLSDHHREYLFINEDDKQIPKGIFLVNHYKGEEPSKRKEAFTQHAIKLGVRENFCLMTSYDLFKLHEQVLTNEISTEEIAKTMAETNGIIKLD